MTNSEAKELLFKFPEGENYFLFARELFDYPNYVESMFIMQIAASGSELHTQTELSKISGYYSVGKLNRIIKKLKAKGLLVIAERSMRTKYRVDYIVLAKLVGIKIGEE